MNFKVFILAVSALCIGLVELIVGGILPIIANDLNVSIGVAGQLITIYALVYAISGPILLTLTAKIERKKLYLLSLAVFLVGNICTYFSSSFALIMAARILTAMSASLVIVLSLTIAAKIVSPEHRAKAIGYIYMGVSSSLVLGIPIGIVITDLFSWRTVFLGIGLLSILSFLLIYFYLEEIPATGSRPLKEQVQALKNKKLLFTHMATMFYLAGHYIVYAYFTPFLQETMNVNSYMISVCYFLFGISAVAGGAIGGYLTDFMGVKKAIYFVLASFTIVLVLLPYATISFALFIIVLLIWGALSWGLAPSQQEYIIQTDKETSDLHQSLNNSSIQVGIALGSGIGGVAIANVETITQIPLIGALVMVVALVSAWFSFRLP